MDNTFYQLATAGSTRFFVFFDGELRSKEFETQKKIAFAATLSVFQDLGYIIESADIDTGFITSKSPTASGFQLFVGQTQSYTKATAFIEQTSKSSTRIRLNFVEVQKTSSGYGMEGGKDAPIEDTETYKNAFAKIQESIFIRKEML